MTLLLSEHDIAQLLDMPRLIEVMAIALQILSSGQVDQPVRSVVQVKEQQAFMGLMPAYQFAPPALGAKLVMVFPHNEQHRLPTHLAIIPLCDPQTGQVLAIMDGRLITEMRTAAVSAVATRAMARSDSRILTIMGAGAQAESHLLALGPLFPWQQIILWNRSQARAVALLEKMAHLNLPLSIELEAESAVRQADVIATVSASAQPILKRDWLKDGVHINAVGSARPTMRELDSATIQSAHVIVDKREAALQEAGDLLIPLREGGISEAAIQGELGQVLAGQVVGRPDSQTITLFKSLGQAIEDVATAHWIYHAAKSKGLGVEFYFQ
jgi:ornithine cyclodeaminase